MKIKILTIIIGLSIIYGGFISSVITKDNSVSYIENKILTKFPKISIKNIYSGRFMKQFDSYSTDQFPYRSDLIKLKNTVDYTLGKREFRNVYVSNNGRLLEHFKLNNENLFNNIEGINNLSDKVGIKSSLLLIPTSTELYKDELPSYALTDNQKDVFNLVREKVDINFISALDILYKNKDKYVFFKTDHHWTQLGAKLVFEHIFNKDICDTPTEVTDEFYGTYYSKALLDFIKPDSIEAYLNEGNYKASIDYDRNINSLYDNSKLESKNKYQYFLSGDPGHAKIEGSGDGNVLILKDSFAHNFIPFMCSVYKEIHVVDARYYNVDIQKYVDDFDINELFFIHNINSLNNDSIYR